MPEPLVSSVVVHTEGAHEAVNVWLRGAHVGKLIVGKGDGAPLASLLLAVSCAPVKQPDPYLAPELWTAEQRATIPRVVPTDTVRRYVGGGEYQDEPDDGLAGATLYSATLALDAALARGVQLEATVKDLEAMAVDVARGSTHELVRWLLEKLIATEKQFETAQAAFAERCSELETMVGSKHIAMVKAAARADAASATLDRVRKALSTSFEYGDRIDAIREALDAAPADAFLDRERDHLAQVIAEQDGVTIRIATDAEQRAALDQAAVRFDRDEDAAARFDQDDPRRQALEKVLGSSLIRPRDH